MQLRSDAASRSRLHRRRVWRNARTISSHNPTINRQRAVSDHVINGTGLVCSWTTGTGSAAKAKAEDVAETAGGQK